MKGSKWDLRNVYMKPEIEICISYICAIFRVYDVPYAAVPSETNVAEQLRKRGQLAFIIRSLFVWDVRGRIWRSEQWQPIIPQVPAGIHR